MTKLSNQRQSPVLADTHSTTCSTELDRQEVRAQSVPLLTLSPSLWSSVAHAPVLTSADVLLSWTCDSSADDEPGQSVRTEQPASPVWYRHLTRDQMCFT